METYFLFLKQDLKDSAPTWMLVGGLAAAAVAGHLRGLWDPILFYPGLGLVLMGLSHPHCRIIWGGRAAAPIAREYLKSLPLPRWKSFVMCFARGLPADLPFALYTVWALTHFNLLPELSARLKGYPILPRSARPPELFLALGLVGLFLIFSQLSSATYGLLLERLSRTNDRRRRLFGYVGLLTLGAGVPCTIAAATGWLVFCLFFGIQPNWFAYTGAWLAIPVTGAHLRWLYRSWLWGNP